MSGELPWLPSLNVGIAEIDDDHRRLLGLMTGLADHVEAFDVARASAAAAEFLAAVDTHFAGEERLMTEDYPDGDDHRGRHAAARALIVRIRDATRAADTIGHAQALLQDLGGEYFRAMLQDDGRLAAWLLSRKG